MALQPFRFLELPPEIREKIYIHTCITGIPYIPLDAPNAHTFFPLNLLLTNTQIYHEIRPIYFTHNFFCLTIRRRNPEWDYILSPFWADNLRQIRALRIIVLRWGTKNFFCEKLMPVLEDCVLNGKLRVLEVLVRDSYVEKLGLSVTEENENWRLLKRLCRDPYLEKVRLRAGPLDELEMEMFWDWEEGDQTLFRDITWLLNDSGEFGEARSQRQTNHY